MLLVLFGLPGSGKTFVGTIIKNLYGYHLYDADSDLPQEMKANLLKALPITDSLRDEFFNRVTKRVEDLKKNYSNLIVTQTFIKEKYREDFLRSFPKTTFILIRTKTDIREKRLRNRKEFLLNISYSRKMSNMFEEPKIHYVTIDNNTDGDLHIKNQLEDLFK